MAGDTGEDQVEIKKNMLRFSLAGVQLKFSAIQGASGGLIIPASGVGGDRIVKLPSREYAGVPENEFSMMSLARMLGMGVSNIGLVDIDSIAGLPDGTERFGTKVFVIVDRKRRYALEELVPDLPRQAKCSTCSSI